MRGSLVVSTNIGHRMRARANTFAGRSVARDAPPLRAESSGADELTTPKRPQKSEREEMMAEADTGPKRELQRCQGIAADKVLGIAWNAPAEEVKTSARELASRWHADPADGLQNARELVLPVSNLHFTQTSCSTDGDHSY